MRLLIVRHADPDYSIDSLTPAGWEEAKLLADRLAPIPVAAYYVSPLGRAKDTENGHHGAGGHPRALALWFWLATTRSTRL